MIELDFYTVSSAAQISYLSLALAMFLVVLKRSISEPSLVRWVQGLVLSGLTGLLVINLNLYASMIWAAASGFIQIFAFGLLMDAVARLGGHRAPYAAILLPATALAGAQLLQSDDTDSRRMLYFLVAGGQFIACTALALSASREILLRSRLLLAGGFLVGAIGHVWRAIDLTRLALAFSSDPHIAGSPTGALLGYISLLWASVMLLHIHFERSDAAAKRLATLDPLTGAYNRRTFIRLGQREIARAQRRGQPLAVLHIRIDEPNIPPEHGARDRMIISLCRTLAEALGQQDVVGRLDETEFGAILPEATLDQGLSLAERLLTRITGLPDLETGKTYSISIGVAERAENELQLGQMLARAEAAVIRARAAGGNRVETAETGGVGRAAISTH